MKKPVEVTHMKVIAKSNKTQLFSSCNSHHRQKHNRGYSLESLVKTLRRSHALEMLMLYVKYALCGCTY